MEVIKQIKENVPVWGIIALGIILAVGAWGLLNSNVPW